MMMPSPLTTRRCRLSPIWQRLIAAAACYGSSCWRRLEAALADYEKAIAIQAELTPKRFFRNLWPCC